MAAVMPQQLCVNPRAMLLYESAQALLRHQSGRRNGMLQACDTLYKTKLVSLAYGAWARGSLRNAFFLGPCLRQPQRVG